jgi:predicted hydrocarbon binding protein
MMKPEPALERSRPRDFNFVGVSNALNVQRPSLGPDAGVALYRLLRLVALEDIIGRGAAGTAYVAGKKLGLNLGVPVLTDSRIHIDVFECVTCSGLKPVGRALCHFEGGLIAGAVESILKKRARAIEVSCIGGLGDDSCGFELSLV